MFLDSPGGLARRWLGPQHPVIHAAPHPAVAFTPHPSVTITPPGVNRGGDVSGLLAHFAGQSAPPGAPPGFDFNIDPEVIAAKAAERLGMGSTDQSLHDSIRSALIGWGDPNQDFLRRAGVSLTPDDRAAIQAAYKSGNGGFAQLQKQSTDARTALIDQLAGQGIINSGATGYQEGQIQQDYGHALFDAQQTLLGGINTARGSALDRRQQLRDAVVRALSNAYNRYLSNPYLYAGVTPPAGY